MIIEKVYVSGGRKIVRKFPKEQKIMSMKITNTVILGIFVSMYIMVSYFWWFSFCFYEWLLNHGLLTRLEC